MMPESIFSAANGLSPRIVNIVSAGRLPLASASGVFAVTYYDELYGI